VNAVRHRRAVAYSATAVIAVGLAVVTALLLVGSGRSASPTGEALDSVSTSGGVIHQSTEVYRRQGPARSVLLESDHPPLPERYIVESWTLFSPEGEIVESLSTTRELDGRLLLRTSSSASEVTIEDLVEGSSRTAAIARDAPAVDLGERIAGARDYYESRVAEGLATESTGGADRTITETSPAWDPTPLDEGVRLPYIDDLNAVTLETVRTLSLDYLPLGTSIYVIDSSGDRTLVESRRFLFIEDLGSDSWGATRSSVLDEES
jgi:hypothetical protein